jgi:hypothetical protein
MDDTERLILEKLHRECTAALARLLKEGEEMCRILSAIERHPASHDERREIMQQRVKENAQHAYDSAAAGAVRSGGMASLIAAALTSVLGAV